MPISAKRFTNFSKENFTCVWDGIPYVIKAGESKMFPSFLAEHIAKHFIDAELTKKGLDTGNKNEREALMKICLSTDLISGQNQQELEVEIMNYKDVMGKNESSSLNAEEKRKPGRPRKEENEVFEGLQQASA